MLQVTPAEAQVKQCSCHLRSSIFAGWCVLKSPPFPPFPFPQVIEKRYFTRDPSQVSQVCVNEPEIWKRSHLIVFFSSTVSLMLSCPPHPPRWHVAFAPLDLQMTGFTDRKRFNFKSLHYDWERRSGGGWPSCTPPTRGNASLTHALSPP